MAPKDGDLLIRTAPSPDENTQFVLLDATSERLIVGPIPFADVVRTAKAMTGERGGEIWQQFADERGRPTGPMMKLDHQLA